MDRPSTIAALSDRSAWGGADMRVCTTHISAVFLEGNDAWKLKKPVNYGFVDYSTLERRRFFCEQEVTLNRPRAPGVYLGVEPVRMTSDGPRIGVEAGEIVDWAVHMKRLPDDATLSAHLERGDVERGLFERIGADLARVHAHAERGPHIARYGARDVILGNVDENFRQGEPEVGVSVSREVTTRLEALQRSAIDAASDLIAARVAASVPCDTHGDLRLEHVYLLDDEVAFVDCIEFNDRFRYADPVADLAFLYMDLAVRGYRAEADALAHSWVATSGDRAGLALLPFYTSYRSSVRGKIAGFRLRDPSLDAASRTAARARSRRHWLFALAELAPPAERPGLVAIGGLPGVGKSTLARALAEAAGFEVIRTDAVRKQAGAVSYAQQAKDDVYAACLGLAEDALFHGKRVILDAGFWHRSHRDAVFDLARRLGVPCLFLGCEADPAVVRARLQARTGDASDADVHIYEQALREWEPDQGRLVAIDTRQDGLSQALAALDAHFAGGSRTLSTT